VNVGNTHMLDMAADLGFKTRPVAGDATVREVVWHPSPSEPKYQTNAAAKQPEKTAS
jgi:hypothetical protein